MFSSDGLVCFVSYKQLFMKSLLIGIFTYQTYVHEFSQNDHMCGPTAFEDTKYNYILETFCASSSHSSTWETTVEDSTMVNFA